MQLNPAREVARHRTDAAKTPIIFLMNLPGAQKDGCGVRLTNGSLDFGR
jgi:hypothetical protein